MSVIKYEPVHFVTIANSASNPKGLKNVASMSAMVFSLFNFISRFTAGIVHSGKYFHVLAP